MSPGTFLKPLDTVGEIAGLHGCAHCCGKSGRHRDPESDKLVRTFPNYAIMSAHSSGRCGAFLISPTVSLCFWRCSTWVWDGRDRPTLNCASARSGEENMM